MVKEVIKTADVSIAAKLRDPNLVLCRCLVCPCRVHLSDGTEVDFTKTDKAWVTREQAVYLANPNQFILGEPEDTDTPPAPEA
jgi:hypothetical protein